MLLSFIELRLVPVFRFLDVHFIILVANDAEVCVHALAFYAGGVAGDAHFDGRNASILNLL